MTPVICQVKHDPPNSYGDCLRAVIASMLDIDPDDVPNFADNGAHPLEPCRWWLGEIGYNLFLTQYPATISDAEIRAFMAELNPNVYYLLFSANHVVICKDDKIVHDPAWYRTALKVPDDAWLVGVLSNV